MMLFALTSIWLDRTESYVLLSISAHRDSQISLSQGVGSLPAKDTSKVNSLEIEHSQHEHSCGCC